MIQRPSVGVRSSTGQRLSCRQVLSEQASKPKTRQRELQRVPQLDGLRAVAVLLVFLSHAVRPPDQGPMTWVLRNGVSMGWMGVDLFFVLSGFLIMGILLRTKGDPGWVRRFLERRSLRILPLYLLLLAATIGLSPVLPYGPVRSTWGYWMFMTNLWPLFQRVNPDLGNLYTTLPHTWSLAVEVQFYLLAALAVAVLSPRRLRQTLWAVVLLSPVARLLANVYIGPGAAYLLTPGRLDAFAMGALLAEQLDRKPSWIEDSLPVVKAGCLTLLGATAVMWVAGETDFARPWFGTVGVTILDGGLVLLVAITLSEWGQARLSALSARPLRGLGRISYGFYLIHYPLILVTVWCFGQYGSLTGWALTGALLVIPFLGTAAIASISWLILERPLLRVRGLWLNRRRPRSAPDPLRREDPAWAAATSR
jgi:peptidoglycan/LPS O-acetylase OafA/YrhL